MRCVNCGRMAGGEDTQCPYCGCPVLSPHDHDAGAVRRAHVRRLWDEPTDPPKVVPLHSDVSVAATRPTDGPVLQDFLLELLLWGSLWFAVSTTLETVGHWGAWLVLVLAVGCDWLILKSYASRPWYLNAATSSRKEQKDDHRAGTAGNSSVSQM